MRERHHLILGVLGSLEKMKIRRKITKRSESLGQMREMSTSD